MAAGSREAYLDRLHAEVATILSSFSGMLDAAAIPVSGLLDDGAGPEAPGTARSLAASTTVALSQHTRHLTDAVEALARLTDDIRSLFLHHDHERLTILAHAQAARSKAELLAIRQELAAAESLLPYVIASIAAETAAD